MLVARGAGGGRGEEGWQGKPNVGQEASLLPTPLSFICSDGVCWQPLGCATSASHSGNSEGIFRYLQFHASVSLP